MHAPASDLRRAEGQDLESGLDVLEGGEGGKEVVELEDEANLGRAKSRARPLGHGGDELAVHHDAARGRHVEGADEVEEGRLAAP